MINSKYKKGWLWIISLLLILIVLNPTYNNFKEFTGVLGVRSAFLHKQYNLLLFSIYSNESNSKKYIGILKNYFVISSKPKSELKSEYSNFNFKNVDSDVMGNKESSTVLNKNSYLLKLYDTASKLYDLGNFSDFIYKLKVPEKRGIFYKAVN